MLVGLLTLMLGDAYLKEHRCSFGEFNTQDRICRKYCALNLRCAIEQEQNARMEILEDLVTWEEMWSKFQ